MNEDSGVQNVDDEESCCAAVIGGNCEDEKPQKECANVVIAGDNSKHDDNERKEEAVTNEAEQSPPPSLSLERVDDNTANIKNENEESGSEGVVEHDEWSGTENYDQHPPSTHQAATNGTIEAGQWSMYIDSVSRRPYFVSHKTGESRWTRPMGPGGIPLPVETSSLGQQMHQFQMFNHHVTMCEKNQAQHSESPSFSSAGEDYDTGRLGNILDKIDGPASSRWYRVPDPQGKGDYYVDAVSGHTQWELPSDYDESLEESAIATSVARAGVAVPSTMLPTLPRDASKCDDYSQSAMFNSKSGHFRGRAEDGDYWQRVGLGYDRETRQMGHYFDVSKLDENRKEAERKRQRLNQRGNGIDWKAYAKEKKTQRMKRKNTWMYEKD